MKISVVMPDCILITFSQFCLHTQEVLVGTASNSEKAGGTVSSLKLDTQNWEASMVGEGSLSYINVQE